MRKWYVYVLEYPDGTPFYVGSGEGNRMYERNYGSRNKATEEIMQQIVESGEEVGCRKLYETDSREVARVVEKYIMNTYFRPDQLTNMKKRKISEERYNAEIERLSIEKQEEELTKQITERAREIVRREREEAIGIDTRN